MSTPQIISSVLALSVGIGIFWMVRKDHLITRDGLKWIVISLGILIYSFFPQLNDVIGLKLCIAYPPIIPLLIGFALVLIKLLIADIERAKMQVTLNRLVQRLAMLETDISQNKK